MTMIDPADRGFTLGHGLFETILWDNHRLDRWDAHLDRMARGAAVLGLPTPHRTACRNAAEAALLAAGSPHRAAVRLNWSAGAGGRGLDLPATPHAAGVAQRMRGVIDHVHANYAEALRITALAEIARLSVAQFERQFVRVMQLTPRAWLTSVRLDAAMHALEQADDSVATIAQACGFADQSAFARTFRKHVGLTPTAYRASRRD